MGRKSSHWIRSMVSIFLFGIILFIAIYFFNPALSIKFFGIGYKMESQESTVLEDFLVEKFNLNKENVKKYLDTEEGKKTAIAIIDKAKKGAATLNDIIDEMHLVDKIKNQDIKTTNQETKETESTL